MATTTMNVQGHGQSSTSGQDKVAVVTGATGGLGYCLAERLLQQYPTIQLCLACRNQQKARDAIKKLEKLAPSAKIDLVILDTSSKKSVKNAASELKQRYKHIDYLFLNAGIMNVRGVDWNYFWKNLFSSKVFYMFTTGEGLLLQFDETTADGLQSVFETNVFGHYILVKELEDVLGAKSGDSSLYSQLVWTSSCNGLKENFSLEDVQCKHGKDPYSSSKYASSVTSVGLNNRLNTKGIYSHAMCPGLVMTNMTDDILPPWFWKLMMPILLLLRIFVPNTTLDAQKGTTAQMWLTQQDPVSLDPQARYNSQCNLIGLCSVTPEQMKIDPGDAEDLLKKLDLLEAAIEKS